MILTERYTQLSKREKGSFKCRDHLFQNKVWSGSQDRRILAVRCSRLSNSHDRQNRPKRKNTKKTVCTKVMEMNMGSNFFDVPLLVMIFAMSEAFSPLWTRQIVAFRGLLLTFATLYLLQFSIITSIITTRQAFWISILYGAVYVSSFLFGVRKRLNVISTVTREAVSRTAAAVKGAPYP